MLPSFDLAGRIAVVTSGSRGIGRAIAQGLAESGADVVIASRKLQSCDRAERDRRVDGTRDAGGRMSCG
jgi:NAD(P)-dependent dehydrogenase (short-subunit alcohol dehydrogenase family)